MRQFVTSLTPQQIKHGYSLIKLMEHLDRELEGLNQKRLSAGFSSAEGQQLTRIKQSHLRKIQDCIIELEQSGFNNWLMERQLA